VSLYDFGASTGAPVAVGCAVGTAGFCVAAAAAAAARSCSSSSSSPSNISALRVEVEGVDVGEENEWRAAKLGVEEEDDECEEGGSSSSSSSPSFTRATESVGAVLALPKVGAWPKEGPAKVGPAEGVIANSSSESPSPSII